MITKEQLEEYQKAYSTGNSLISDEAYDLLLEEYVKEHGESSRPFTRNKQSDAVNDVVGTLGKTFGVVTPMREGQPTYKDWLLRHTVSRYIITQPKFDGTSIAYDVNAKRFFTRGDYDNGESVDVTDIFSTKIPLLEQTILMKYPNVTAIKFEAILNVDAFQAYFSEKYKRPRDVVSATITSRNTQYAHFITLVPLRVYIDGEQHIPDYLCRESLISEALDYHTLEAFIENLLKHSAHVSIQLPVLNNGEPQYAQFEFECDGVVVSSMKQFESLILQKDSQSYCSGMTINPPDDGIVIGGITDPTTEVAIKILNLVETTTLKDIQWQFGSSGRITPVAIVEPVKFGNITVTNIGLSTFERVASMGLKYGDTVRIVYNIVPYFLDSQHDGTLPILIPNKCPRCGAPLDMRTLRQVQCINPNCDGRRLGAIIRYCKKMKMFGVSEGIITKLWDTGYVNDISDLYTMDLLEACEVDGLGEKSLKNIVNSIKHASTNVPVHRWLGALPCYAVSAKTWKTILKSVYGNHNKGMMQADITRMCMEDTPDVFLNKMLWYTYGIGAATIASINEGIRNHWDTIKTIIHYITFEEGGSSGTDKGIVCLSGTRDETLKTALEQKGYEVTDSFNKRCVAVIIPNPMFESSKVRKAHDHGIPVYTMNQVYNENVL